MARKPRFTDDIKGKLEVSYLRLEDLAPATRNARTHSSEQIAQLVASIHAFGWTSPILIDEDRAIIAGHGRLEAARAAGLADVPTMDALPEAETRMIIGNSSFKSITIGSVDHTCPTIMAGGSRTAGEFVDGTERRKFSIAELKRICGFPDDYVLTGSYADQWARCGNAVPPVMMSHIAAAMVPVLTERRLVDAA